MDEVAAIALQTRVAELCGHLNVLHAQLVDTIVEALDGELWQQWGIRSPEHWLAWQTGLAPARARQLVATARRKNELPVTFAAFADGELSVDQVVTVARHTPAHNDAEVCELAKAASVTQLRSCLSRYVHHLDPPAEPPAATELAADRRDLLVSGSDDDGRYTMHVNAPAHHGAIIDQALGEARDALFAAGHTNVTWLDALVEVCNRSLDTIASASRRDRYRIYLHLDTDSAGGPAHAWLNGGPQLPDSLRDVLCCNGIIQPLWHTAGLPVNVGRAHHIVPKHTRRLILDRDRACRHPTCTATTHLDIHHILEWVRNGPTNTDNLLALCPKHHHAYHRAEYSMSGNPNIPEPSASTTTTADPFPTAPNHTRQPSHRPPHHPARPTPTPSANPSTPTGSTSPPPDESGVPSLRVASLTEREVTMTLDEIKRECARLSKWAHLATVRPSGAPDVVPVQPAWSGHTLWVFITMDSMKARNVATNPNVALHWQVDDSFDGVEIWGVATLHNDVPTKRRLWTGVFDFDLDDYAPDGPERSLGSGFMEIRPLKALHLLGGGAGGVHRWAAAG